MKPRRAGVSERGVAVLVVLVVLAIGALAGTVALLSARGAGESASQSVGLLQSQLTMRSGVLALGVEALNQRGEVLGGGDFVFDAPLEVFEEGGRSGVFRFDARLTEAPVSLDALLDVNTADAEMLARLPGVDEALAQAMASALPVESIRALLAVEGMTVALLFGEYDEFGRLVSEGVPLASLLTVGSIDPAVSAGAGGVEPGRRRVGIDRVTYSSFEPDLAQVLGEGPARECVQYLVRDPVSPSDLRAFATSALRGGIDPAQLGLWLDGLTGGRGPVRGRIDINRAPVEVLATIPGFDDEVAQKIVDARVSAPAGELASVLWPLERGLVDEEGMLRAIDRVTTRSVRWVLRAEAGLAASRERSVGVDSVEDARRIADRSARDDLDRLADRVAMDLLVDFSGDRPVVVPLGEVSIAVELADVASVLSRDRGQADAPGPAGRGGRP